MRIKKLLSNKLIKASGWYTVTEFFIKGISFITLPIFTRLLTTTEFGIVSLYNSWVQIFTILLSLSLYISIARGKQDFTKKYNQFVSSITSLLLFILIVYLLLFWKFNDWILNLTEMSFWVFYIMISYSFFSSIKKILLVKLRYEYKYKLVSIVIVIPKICGVIFSIFLMQYVFSNEKYLGIIIGQSSLLIITGIFSLIYLLYKGKEFINLQYWKYALVLSLPLIAHDLSGVINIHFDRIIISKFIGEASTGIYSFAYNIGLIISILTVATTQAFTPWFFEKMKHKNYSKIKEVTNWYRNIFLIIYTGVLLISPEIVKIMSDRQYWIGLKIVPWIFLAYYFLFLTTLETRIELYTKKTKLVSIGTIIAAGINIILNIIFIPIYGYIAAAVTTVISYFFGYIFHILITTKIIKIDFYGIRFRIYEI
jgi:O-antigen/teichoic acid export membrane protein